MVSKGERDRWIERKKERKKVTRKRREENEKMEIMNTSRMKVKRERAADTKNL